MDLIPFHHYIEMIIVLTAVLFYISFVSLHDQELITAPQFIFKPWGSSEDTNLVAVTCCKINLDGKTLLRLGLSCVCSLVHCLLWVLWRGVPRKYEKPWHYWWYCLSICFEREEPQDLRWDQNQSSWMWSRHADAAVW